MSTFPSPSSSDFHGWSSVHRRLRNFFILGYALNIILWFVPAVTMRVGTLLGFGGEEKTLSMFSMVRLISQQHNLGLTIFLVGVFAGNIVFIALALAHPRRWVFITASSVAAFFILLNLFSGSNEQIHYLLVPRVLGWCATLLTLTGFVIKPPVGVRAQL